MQPPSRLRVRRIFTGLVVVGLAAWLVPSYFSAERYRRRLQAGLEQALHRPVKFSSLSIRLLPRPGFSIQNVEVGEDPDFGIEPFARVDQIDCDLRWHSLWHTRMDFAHLHLDHPDFNVVVNAAGRWNIESFLLQSGVTTRGVLAGAGKSAAMPQPLDLDADDARINFQIGLDKKPFALTDVRARLQVNPADRRVGFQITASPFRSDLSLPTPGPVEATGTWEPGADLRGSIDARLRGQGSQLYDWIPVVLGSNPQIYGVMDSDIHITGTLPALSIEGDTSIAQLQRWGGPPPADAAPLALHYRGQLIRGRERLQVESLDASFGDSRLHVAGTVADLRSSPRWDCVVSIDRSNLEDLAALVRRFRPGSTAWSLKGRLNAMLTIQGVRPDLHYAGYVGVQQASLETASGSFPFSEVAVRISDKGAVLAPVQIAVAPHVALTAQGSIDRSKSIPKYNLQIVAKAVPLGDAAALGRGLGLRALNSIGATGSLSGSVHLTGNAWPLERPAVSAKCDLRAGRLLIPGLTEALNIPHAVVEVNGSQIVADPVVAVIGTSVLTGTLEHLGARARPWKFEIHANSLNLTQAARWFDVLGGNGQSSLFQLIPGLASFTVRREEATHLFDRLNAEGNIRTPVLTYRGAELKEFAGAFVLASRQIRMRSSTFQIDGGSGNATGSMDFSVSPPTLTAEAGISNVSIQTLEAYLPGAARTVRGAVSSKGTLRTRGLTWSEMADNLTGRFEMRSKEISFGSFDPLEALAEVSHWGKLEPVRGPVATAPPILNLELKNRRILMDPAVVDLNGALLHLQGSYAWSGALDFSVGADLQHLRRRWLQQEEAVQAGDSVPEVRLTGKLDHLSLAQPEGVITASKFRGGTLR